MNSNKTTYEELDRYLSGEMSADEKTAFKAKINADPDLAKMVDDYQTLLKGMERLHLKGLATKAYQLRKLANLTVWTAVALVLSAAAYFGYHYVFCTEQKESTEIIRRLPEYNENGTKEWIAADSLLPTQIYTINTEADTVVETDAGILFSIPEGAFLDENGKPVIGNVSLEIREALDAASIISSGLTTLSDGKLLETGGMFYLNARKEGKSLTINPEKPVLADIPTHGDNKDMMLFDGERKADGNINWVNPKPIESFLVAVPVEELNFYPPNYLDTLKAMNLNTANKKFTDSLYLSFENVLFPMNSQLKFTTSKSQASSDIDKEFRYIENFQTSDTLADEEVSEEVAEYLPPSSILAIHTSEFNHTFIATREFEERMNVIHTHCSEDILNLYVRNLDKPLWYADSLAWRRTLSPRFEKFYLQKKGRVKAEQPGMEKLMQHYAKKAEAYRKTAALIQEKQQEEFVRKTNEISAARNEHTQKEASRVFENFKEEHCITFKDVCKQLGLRGRCFDELPKSERMVVPITSTGHKNIDRFVAERVVTRISGSLSLNGKTATVTFDEVTIKVNGEHDFTPLFVYLIPDQLNSFVRADKKADGVYTYSMNTLLNYSLTVVGYKGKEMFVYTLPKVEKGEVVVNTLTPTTPESFNKAISAIKPGASQKLTDDMQYFLKEAEFSRFLAKRKADADMRKRLYGVIFPCFNQSTGEKQASIMGLNHLIIILMMIQIKWKTDLKQVLNPVNPVGLSAVKFEKQLEMTTLRLINKLKTIKYDKRDIAKN